MQRALNAESGSPFGAGGAPGGDPMGGLGSMFSDPGLIAKLAANPKTSSLLADREFVQKLQRIQQDPKSMGPMDMQDPRFLSVLGVLLGIDLNMSEGGPGSADAKAREMGGEPMEEVHMGGGGAPEMKREKEPESEPDVEMEDEEAKEKREKKAKADEEKKLGTDSYKKRQFDQAIEHYGNAWEMFKDITYLNNLGAAYFEKGDYDACIETCKKAITEGRDMLADFKLIAKYVEPQHFSLHIPD